jgi:hypothetical protein
MAEWRETKTVFRDALYHWAPTERRGEILKSGLIPHQRAVTHGYGKENLTYPYISLSPTPSMAWGLSGEFLQEECDIEEWDLWQVYLDEYSEVYIRPFFGKHMEEIKVSTPLRSVWLIGSRTSDHTAARPLKGLT